MSARREEEANTLMIAAGFWIVRRACVFSMWTILLLSLAPKKTSVAQAQGSRFPFFIITPSQLDDDSPFPLSPARLCLTEMPTICYSPPDDQDLHFGRNPVAWRLDGTNDEWLMFSAESGGGSGWSSKVAILRFDTASSRIQNLLPEQEISNLGEWAAWQAQRVSQYPLFVRADYEWEGMQAHYAPHRYAIEVLKYDPSANLYKSILRYQTHKFYQSGDDDRAHLLSAERHTVMMRLNKLSNSLKQRSESNK